MLYRGGERNEEESAKSHGGPGCGAAFHEVAGLRLRFEEGLGPPEEERIVGADLRQEVPSALRLELEELVQGPRDSPPQLDRELVGHFDPRRCGRGRSLKGGNRESWSSPR